MSRRGWGDMDPFSRRSGFSDMRTGFGGFSDGRRSGFGDFADDRRTGFGGMGFSDGRRMGFPQPYRTGFGAGFPDRRRFGAGDGGGAKTEEIASKSIIIQSKKFYIDVRKNNRGKFFKISEVAPTGQKMRLTMDMSVAKDFVDKLNDFCDFYTTLGPEKWDRTRTDEGKLKSESIFTEDRRYYMDLKENHRGRFLKLSMALSTYERVQIVIPAQGMIDFCSILIELLAEHGPSESDAARKESAANMIEHDGKKFMFDIEDGHKGKIVRISEVSPNFRTAVNIPQELWSTFAGMIEQALVENHGNGDDAGHIDDANASTSPVIDG